LVFGAATDQANLQLREVEGLQDLAKLQAKMLELQNESACLYCLIGHPSLPNHRPQPPRGPLSLLNPSPESLKAPLHGAHQNREAHFKISNVVPFVMSRINPKPLNQMLPGRSSWSKIAPGSTHDHVGLSACKSCSSYIEQHRRRGS
jgi:hypothetical protein